MTNAERQARFREQMRERGFVQVNEWVPKDRKDELRKIAKAMREEDQRIGFSEMVLVDSDDKLTVRWDAGFDAHMRKVLRDL